MKEEETHMNLKKTIQDWRVGQAVEVPAGADKKFDLVIEADDSNPNIEILVGEVGSDERVRVLVEINHGVPCLHLYADENGDDDAIIFFHKGKVILVPGRSDVGFERVSANDCPEYCESYFGGAMVAHQE